MTEEERLKYEANIRAAERAHDANERFYEQTNAAAIESANVALRAFLLINGGAAVAMLAFLGALVGEVSGEELIAIASPLATFAWGVASAALGAGFGYLTNYFNAWTIAGQTKHWEHPYVRNDKGSKITAVFAIGFIVIAVATSFLSLWFFVVGMRDVAGAMRTVFAGT